jgi:hypothetical protein
MLALPSIRHAFHYLIHAQATQSLCFGVIGSAEELNSQRKRQNDRNDGDDYTLLALGILCITL